MTKRKYAKVRSSDGIQGAEAWDNYEYSQSNRKALANQWTPVLSQGAEHLLGSQEGPGQSVKEKNWRSTQR